MTTDSRLVPHAADAVFGNGLPLAVRYAELLATSAVERGLIGPREVTRLWDRHLLNCAVIEELIPEGQSVIDAGSGAGLPGIPLAIARPDLTIHLVEPMRRRSEWLTEAVATLRLTHVDIHRERAERLQGAIAAHVVVVRAVARLDLLAAWCLPLLTTGGCVLAIKGQSAEAELASTREALGRIGVSAADVLTVGHGRVSPPTTVARLRGSVTPAQRRRRAQRAR